MASSTKKQELTGKSTLHSKVLRESVVAPKKGRRASSKKAEVVPAPAKRKSTRGSKKAAAVVESPSVIAAPAVMEAPVVVERPAEVEAPAVVAAPVAKHALPVEAPVVVGLKPVEVVADSGVPAVDDEAIRKASRLAEIRKIASRKQPRPTAARAREEAAPAESAMIPAVTPSAMLSGTMAEVIVLECVPVPEAAAADSAGARLEAVELSGAFEVERDAPAEVESDRRLPAQMMAEAVDGETMVAEPAPVAVETIAEVVVAEATPIAEAVVAETTPIRVEAIPADVVADAAAEAAAPEFAAEPVVTRAVEALAAPAPVVLRPAPTIEAAFTSIVAPAIQPALSPSTVVRLPETRHSTVRPSLLPVPIARRPPPPPPPRRREPVVVKSVRWVVSKLLRWAGR